MIKTVNGYADVYGSIGYAVHARNFFRELNELVPVCLVPKHNRLPDGRDFDLMAPLLERLMSIDLNTVSINLDYPDEMYRFGGKKRIGYTVFESNQLSSPAVSQLSQLDQVWVASAWAKEILKANGVTQNNVYVVPEGVDTSLFKKGLEPYPQITRLEGYRFLAIGKWEERKGVKDLLKAFDEAFSPTDPAYLVVYFLSQVNALKNINVASEIDALGLKNRNKIITVNSAFSTDESMARLYASCDAFVSASKAEGWCLPLMEAMACGLPVIAPYYSGPTEYLKKDNSFLVEVKELEDIYCPIFFPEKGAYGQWAKIEVKNLSEQMRKVYDQKDQAKQIAEKGFLDVTQNFTWKHSAQKAFDILKTM